MKTLYEVCKPRESVFDESKRDDTLDLSNIVDSSINGQEFFEETYITKGMELLFDTVFNRFRGKASSGLIKLTQSMGGGKTHNMLALGILAKNRSLRSTILDGKYGDFKDDINVVAFTGRESDIKFGIWGEIADQLGKKDYFKDYYSPLSAPGQTSWINLLKSDKPTLILLDELPPYLQNAKAIEIGTSTLAVVTETALANLFNAINKEELHNVCIVVSDLQATYEEGSQILQKSFKNLDNEISRSATNIEPVGANTNDLYNILKTRLFEEVGDQGDINEIIEGYRKAINETRQMGYTNFTADEIATGIQLAYPFHPSIRDLFARFKENPGFQQTRGYIRLTRLMLKDLYTEKNGEVKAKKNYLINAYDIDLNNSEMVTTVRGIKPSITNAISHDIADNGQSVAENIDRSRNSIEIQEISKLILVSSLGNVSNAIIGLSVQEVIGYMAQPDRDITSLRKGLEEYSTKAWYLYRDSNNRLYFKDVKNVNAELIDLVNTYSYEHGKQSIKELLQEKFKPELGDCYQMVEVFPSIDEISIERDKITLILAEPSQNQSGLNKDLLKFYEDSSYKNRMMFLTGQRNSMDNLVNKGKEYLAIQNIMSTMRNQDNISETDPQYKQATDLFDKINLELISTLRESFVTLYYPKRRGLISDDITMRFDENNYDIEEQIKTLLIDKMKFETDTDDDEFHEKLESRIFTQKQMRWTDVKERAATITSWSWHHPNALEDLKRNMLSTGKWIETGGYIDKEPPAPETTLQVREIFEDENTGEVTLKLQPIHGDIIYYDIGQDATPSSMKVENIESFKTKELKLSFLCEDSKGENDLGDPVEWIKDVKVKYQIYDKDSKQFMKLMATSDDVEIYYTTDGSNPLESGGIFVEDFPIPKGTKFVQAIAVNKELGINSDLLVVEITENEFSVDRSKPLTINEPLVFNDKVSTFVGLEELGNFDVSLWGVTINIMNNTDFRANQFLEFTLGKGIDIDNPTFVIEELKRLFDLFFTEIEFEVSLTINETTFKTGNDFERWVSSRKEKIIDYKDWIKQ